MEAILNMIYFIVSVKTCLWIARRLRGGIDSGGNKPDSGSLANRSLKWGMAIVTLPALFLLGLLRFANGQGVPSLFTLVTCTGLTALIMMGTPVEIIGNIIIDTLIISGVVTFVCLTIVNGIPLALGFMCAGSIFPWFIACVFVAVFVRAVFWADKGE